MSREPQETSRRWGNRVLVVAALPLLLAYLLSPKLVVWFHLHGALHESRALGVAMFPLQVLYENIEPVRRFYDWYEPRWVDSF